MFLRCISFFIWFIMSLFLIILCTFLLGSFYVGKSAMFDTMVNNMQYIPSYIIISAIIGMFIRRDFLGKFHLTSLLFHRKKRYQK